MSGVVGLLKWWDGINRERRMRDQGKFDFFVWCRANQEIGSSKQERKTCKKWEKKLVLYYGQVVMMHVVELSGHGYCCFFLLLAHHLLGNNLVLSKELATALMDGQVLQYHLKWSSPQKITPPWKHALTSSKAAFLSLTVTNLTDWREWKISGQFPWVHFLYDSLYVLMFLVIGLVRTYLIISFCITPNTPILTLYTYTYTQSLTLCQITPIYYRDG